MKTVRFNPVLAGATALALITGTAAFAQQSSDPAQQPAQAQAQAQPSEQFAGLGQQLQQARQALEQQDAEQARQALQQLSEALEQAMQNADDQTRQMLEDVQAKLQQAVEAVENGDAEAAVMALDEVEMSMQSAGLETGQGGAGQQQAQQQTSEQQQQASGQQQPQQQASGQQQPTQQQASGQQQPQQQPGQQQPGQQQAQQGDTVRLKAKVVKRGAGEGEQKAEAGQISEQSQVSQDAIWQAEDLLAEARQDLESAMQAVQEAEAALRQAGGVAERQDNVTVTVSGRDDQQAEQATARQAEQPTPQQAEQATARQAEQANAAQRQVPQRLSMEETTRLLSLGGRELAPASQMADLAVADLQGRGVMTMDGQDIGKVDRLVNNGGQIFAIVEHGGFLGIGEDRVPIPADRLGLRGDRVILLGLTEEQLKRIPEYDIGTGQEMGGDEMVQIGIYE